MRRKSLSQVMVPEVMSLHDGAKTRVGLGSAYSEEFQVKVFCTSMVCAVANIVCNSCYVITKKCKKE